MTKAVFFDPYKHFYDRHGIYTLASILKKEDIDVSFVSELSFKKAITRIRGLRPDLLLYSAISSSLPAFIRFDKCVKEEIKVLSIIGGPGPTFDPNCLRESSIDAACLGEGDYALIEFIRLGFKSTKNIFRRGESLPTEFYPFAKLDDLPFPDRELIYREDITLKNSPSKQFLSGRGCPYQCTYCFNHKFNSLFRDCGQIVRKKSVRYLLDEILAVKKKYPLNNVVFNDDTFILDKKWLFEFCERFPKEIGLPYTCNIRANLVEEDVAKALSESRCRAVNWSIESGDDFLRNQVLKRGVSADQILKTAEFLTKYKIRYRIGNVIGLPGESFKQMLKTLELNIAAKPNLGLANIFVPFPGLALTDYATDHGYYKPDPANRLPADFYTKSVLNVDQDMQQKIQKILFLFPILVACPKLYHQHRIFKWLFYLPRFLLKVFYECFYTYKMMRFYRIESSLIQKIRMALRYVMSLRSPM